MCQCRACLWAMRHIPLANKMKVMTVLSKEIRLLCFLSVFFLPEEDSSSFGSDALLCIVSLSGFLGKLLSCKALTWDAGQQVVAGAISLRTRGLQHQHSSRSPKGKYILYMPVRTRLVQHPPAISEITQINNHTE